LIFGVPLFAFVVLTTVFSRPVIRELGVTVVDEDRSDASHALVEYVAASPSLQIVDRSGTLSTAARDIRSGKAISAIYIPPDFERDLKADRRPQVVGFYNQQFLTAAGIASSGLSDTLSAAAAVAAPAKRAAPTPASIGTLSGETIALVNPQKNYAQFLLRALLPMIIHVVITLAGGYAVGSEFRRRNAREWLESAGGDPVVALVGKLAPLFGIFFLIMLAEPLVLEGVLQVPFRGDVPLMVAAGSLLIVAYLSLGALLQLLAGDLATGLGLAGLFVSPAFGYAGVGFPTVGMNAFAQVWSAILPLRWYMAVLLGQAARGLPVSETAVPFAALAGLTVLYAGLALLRMSSVKRNGRFEMAGLSEPPEIGGTPREIGGAFTAEWRRVLGTRSAFSLLFLAPLVYGLYYPQPYLNQILRKLPIAVVDNDLSDLSRRIVETLDASGALSVAVRARTLAEARTAIDRGRAFAAVEIPPDTERDVLKGITAHIPVYADATYLFIFRSTASGVAAAVGALTSELVSRGARSDGSLVKAKLASLSPAVVLLQPIFNPVGGYASYIVPAAFVLILQQTLLIGAAMLTGTALAKGGGAFAGVFGRGVAHLTIYLPALALYLIVLPRIYGFSALGNLAQLFALASVFLLATSFMGQAIGAWFTRPENATLVLLATSLPQFFTTGFAWPREAIPDAAIALSRIFPADFAIDGLVRINQLGASIREVAHDWLGLWCLALVYFALAVISARAVKRRQRYAQG
jgi:ABC-2 type transport system permease protein